MLTHRFYTTLIFCVIIISFTVGCRRPEIIFPTGETTINAGESISFSAAYYPDAIYKWTFDGGAKDTLEQNPTVTFNRPGVYYVYLTVVYNDFDSGFAFRKVIVAGTSGPAPVAKTGQTISYETGDDGDLEKGVSWPNPRFTDNGDGTVTDNLTGLMWLKDANCIQTNYPGFDKDEIHGDGQVTWQHALDFVSGINAGTYSNCGGGYTDWRLPNVKELQSLLHYAYYDPAVPNTAGTGQWTSGDPFTGVQSSSYWSATTYASDTSSAWLVRIYVGNVYHNGKSLGNNVWPVRGGQ